MNSTGVALNNFLLKFSCFNFELYFCKERYRCFLLASAKSLVLNLGSVRNQQGALKILTPTPHQPNQSKTQRLGPRHQYFFKFPGFKCIVNVKNFYQEKKQAFRISGLVTTSIFRAFSRPIKPKSLEGSLGTGSSPSSP